MGATPAEETSSQNLKGFLRPKHPLRINPGLRGDSYNNKTKMVTCWQKFKTTHLNMISSVWAARNNNVRVVFNLRTFKTTNLLKSFLSTAKQQAELIHPITPPARPSGFFPLILFVDKCVLAKQARGSLILPWDLYGKPRGQQYRSTDPRLEHSVSTDRQFPVLSNRF